jgi:hypothetical protein
MKRITSIIVKSLFAILISGGLSATANAQYDPGITIDIPFAFSANGQEIAAGTYQLQLISSNFLMSVRNVKTGNQQMITVHPAEARQISSEARLAFQVCEGHSYLTEVHVPGTNLFSETVNGHTLNDARTNACSRDDSITIALR